MTDITEQYGFTIAGIDTFGNQKIESGDIIDLLGVKEGMRFDLSMPNTRKMRENVEAFGWFSHVHVALVLYPDGTAYVTADVIEKESERSFNFRSAPTESIELPPYFSKLYNRYVTLWSRHIRFHISLSVEGEDESEEGYGFSANARLRDFEEQFIELTKQHPQLLTDTLNNDRSPRKRLIVAFLMRWSPDPSEMVSPLSAALSDSHPTVRNNAALSLKHVSRVAAQTKKFEVPLPPVVDMLHLPFTTDRQKAALILAELAKSKASHPELLSQAGHQLMQMLVLKQPSNRDAACEVFRQLSGLNYTADRYDEWQDWYQQATRGTITLLPEG